MVERMSLDEGVDKSENVAEKLREYIEKTITIEIPPGPQCYCGDPRDFKEPEFQCSVCSRWFHQKCIAFDIGPSLPFMRAYHFMCKKCNVAGEEVFSKKQPNFINMCQTTLANLMCIHNGRIYFSMEREIIPFLESNWEVLTTQPRKANDTWHTYIHKALTSNELFTAVEIKPEFVVALACQDIGKIGPSYDQFRALTSQLKSKIDLPPPQNDASGRGDGSTSQNTSSNLGGDGGGCSRKGGGGIGGPRSGGGSHADQLTGSERGNNMRSTRRSTAAGLGPHNGSSFHSTLAVDDSKAKVNSFGVPIDHPFNKEGYRYILVEPDPHAVGRQLWDESEHTAGKPIPGYFYRVCLCPKVLLSLNDRAHQLKLHESQTIITGEKGYCMARATHSVYTGTWYYEATIKEQPEGSATRIGWSQLLGNLQAPCGYDKFSYSWRSRLGTAFHNSRGQHFADQGYAKEDVIGCLIHLPKQKGFVDMPITKSVSIVKRSGEGVSKKSNSQTATAASADVPLLNYLPETYKDRPLIKFRNYYYFEEKDDPAVAEKKLRPLPGAKIVFYRNGECIGTAFQDIYAGAYFPVISIYKSATVSVNFGPDFKYPPSSCGDWIAMSERLQSAEIEQTMADMIYLTENHQLISNLIKECAGS